MIKDMKLFIYDENGKVAKIQLTKHQIELVSKVLGIEIDEEKEKVFAYDTVSLEHILNCKKEKSN